MKNHTTEQTFIDMEIRIFPSDAHATGYPVEITLGEQQAFPQGYLPADILSWTSSGDPVEDGQQLFKALFGDNLLRQAWAEARGESAQRRVRLRIDANAPELHTLPWELLHEGETMLSANADTPFSRYLTVSEPWGGAVEERPVRVLAAISSPKDLEDLHNLAPLDIEVEQTVLEKAFLALDEDQVQLDFLEPPVTLERIEEALQSGYHILHYVGHGIFNERRQQAALYLQDAKGNADAVFDTAFIEMLARQPIQARPRLIFLAACQSATRSTASAFLGLGPKLVVAGVPAVVAMQDSVAIKTARKLSLAFYRRLAEHGIVDWAMNEARSTLLTAGQPDAAVPVLFMRLKSGQLWETEAETQAEAEFPLPPKPNLPPEMTSFVGREAELADYADKLSTDCLAVIIGMPGVGKTTLATALVHRSGEPGKTFWHTFHPDVGIEEVVWKLAGFLYWHGQQEVWAMLQRTRLSGGQPPPTRDLLDYLAQTLRGQGYLLCLDDLQFLAEDDAQLLDHFVRQLNDEGTPCVIVSQVVPSFTWMTEVKPLAGLSLQDTHRLLDKRGLSLPSNLGADLHTRTGGNAQFLALSLDAMRHTQEPEHLLARLSDTADIEHFLMTEVDQALTEDEQKTMSGVAVLLGYPGTRDAIEATIDTDRLWRTLIDLSNRCLLTVQQTEAGKEYGQNALIRDFYYSLLSRRQRHQMHHRAAEYYQNEYTEIGAPQDLLKAALHYERAQEHERAAELATQDIWALINQGHTRRLCHLLEQFTAHHLSISLWERVNLALGEIYTLRRESKPARDHLNETWSILNTLPDDLDVRERKARVCRWIGVLLEPESLDDALKWLRQGLDELQGASTLEEAILHIRIGSVRIGQGEYAAALDALEKGLELLPEGHSHWRAAALNNLGIVYRRQGQVQQGQDHHLHALNIYQQSNDYWGVVSTRINLGIAMKDASDWPSAATQYGQALKLAEKLGLTRHCVNLELTFGDLHLKLGEHETAAQHLSQCIQLAQQHNLQEHRVYAQTTLADLRVRQENWEAAEALLRETEQLALDLGSKFVLLYIYRDWARVRLNQDRVPDAHEFAERALNFSREMEISSEEGMSMCVMGRVLLAEGQTEAALDAFEHSLSLLANRDPYEAARTKHQWGLALISEENAEQGIALLQEARATFADLNAKHDLAIVNKALRE